MKLRSFQVQESRRDHLSFFNVPRVDYDALLDSLRYPLVWAYDPLLEIHLPAEVDHSFINFLASLPPIDLDLRFYPERVKHLRRAGLMEPVRPSHAEMLAEMRERGNVRLVQLLDAEYCRSLMHGYYYRNDHLHCRHSDMMGIKRTSVNNMPLMRLIHQGTEKLINSLVTEPVKTSYSFASAYEAGTKLPAHRDRPQCVYNVSLMLASNPNRARLSDWPLFIQTRTHTHTVPLEVGDGVLYSGTRDLHWRNEIPKSLSSVLGVFFHYVPVDFTGSLD